MTCPCSEQMSNTAAHLRQTEPWETTPWGANPGSSRHVSIFQVQGTFADQPLRCQWLPLKSRTAQPGSTDTTVQFQLAGDAARKAAVPLPVPSTQGARTGLGVPLAGHASLQPHPYIGPAVIPPPPAQPATAGLLLRMESAPEAAAGNSWLGDRLCGTGSVGHAKDQTPYFSSTPGVLSSVGNSKWATKGTLKGCPLPSSPSARLS